MPHHKSDVEEPWDRFVRAFTPALKRASRTLSQRYHRTLAMGEATRLATPNGDVIRFPIVVRNGPGEYAVATVYVHGPLKKFYDEVRLEEIAKQAAAEAEKYGTTPPPKPGSLVLTYP